jgi:hypothetical protein
MANRTGNSMSSQGNFVDSVGAGAWAWPETPDPSVPYDHGEHPTPDNYEQHGPQLSELPKPVPATPQALMPAVESYATQGETAGVAVPNMRQPVDAGHKPQEPAGSQPKRVIPPESFKRKAARWETGQPYSGYSEPSTMG